MKASIIIVTRNRADDLRQTLEAMKVVAVPEGLELELMVVDNGSTDGTRALVESLRVDSMPLRYVREDRGGQSAGRNRGLAETNGDIILFTDDDVRPPPAWVDGMCEPLVRGHADAVCGGVHLAPQLLRSWMGPIHRNWLAATEWIRPGRPQSMVGANMGFLRSVLTKVPRFDPDLGPGAAGFADDHLFASQLLEAGFRIHDRRDLSVEHHFEVSRLARKSWLDGSRRRGISHAYVGHHWEHWSCRMTRLRLRAATMNLAAWRFFHPEAMGDEGCCEDELKLMMSRDLLVGHLMQSRDLRRYDHHGLVRLDFDPN